MRAERLWPIGIAVVLLVTVAGNGVVLWLAHDRDAAAIEPDYYRRAVSWDSTMAQQRRNADLGWGLDATLGPLDAEGAELRVRIADRDGTPLEGARIAVAALHNREAGRIVRATLEPAAPGVYAARLPLGHAGLWEVRLVVERGSDHFTSDHRLEALPR